MKEWQRTSRSWLPCVSCKLVPTLLLSFGCSELLRSRKQYAEAALRVESLEKAQPEALRSSRVIDFYAWHVNMSKSRCREHKCVRVRMKECQEAKAQLEIKERQAAGQLRLQVSKSPPCGRYCMRVITKPLRPGSKCLWRS